MNLNLDLDRILNQAVETYIYKFIVDYKILVIR